VTGALKRAIEDHFDSPNAELIKNLQNGKKEELIDEIKEISELASFIYIRQKGPYGNGTPVLSAEPVIDNETFAVMWGDEFIYSNPPRLAQMIKVYEKYGGAVISAVRIAKREDLYRYGIAKVKNVEKNIYKIEEIVEKPKIDEAPSDLATHGAYILPPDIFELLRKQEVAKDGEIYLSKAIDDLIKQGYPVYACEIENGKYYDTGNKLEYMKTVVEMGLQHKDINGEFRQFLKDLKL